MRKDWNNNLVIKKSSLKRKWKAMANKSNFNLEIENNTTDHINCKHLNKTHLNKHMVKETQRNTGTQVISIPFARTVEFFAYICFGFSFSLFRKIEQLGLYIYTRIPCYFHDDTHCLLFSNQQC